MATTLTIRDASLTGETLHEWTLEFPVERITVEELIRSRVYQEVQDYNRLQPDRFRGLIQPEEEEQALNGPRATRRRLVDWRRQFDQAIKAFLNGQVIILVGDRQVVDLEEEIELDRDTPVSFLRLSLLTGG
jgi:hypothetical protein